MLVLGPDAVPESSLTKSAQQGAGLIRASTQHQGSFLYCQTRTAASGAACQHVSHCTVTTGHTGIRRATGEPCGACALWCLVAYHHIIM